MHKSTNILLATDSFRNNVMCRRNFNQFKAWRIYNQSLRHLVSDQTNAELYVESSHYLMEQISHTDFGDFIKKVCDEAIGNQRKYEELTKNKKQALVLK